MSAAVANFAAYSFAPPIMVTPLGALSVIIGCVRRPLARSSPYSYCAALFLPHIFWTSNLDTWDVLDVPYVYWDL